MKKQKNKETKKSGGILDASISIGGVSFTEKALFAKHMAVMLRSGLTIAESLDIVTDSAKGSFKKVLSKVSTSVKGGSSLSDAFKKFPKVFSGLFVTTTYAGEKSGTLVENLETISKELEKEKVLKEKIKGAMIYPIVVLIATFVLGMGLSFFVLPKIVPLFTGLRVELPWTTRMLIQFSEIVKNNGIELFFGIIIVIFLIVFLLRRKFMKPFTHGFILHFPIVKKISRNTNLSRFCRSLATLLKSGLTITESFEVLERSTENFYYKRAIRIVGKRIQSGTTVSEELEKFGNLFPVIVTRMIKVGEESGNLDSTLLYLADFYESEVDSATKALSTAIEPILLLIIGLAVGFLALSIITPIYDITGNIRR